MGRFYMFKVYCHIARAARQQKAHYDKNDRSVQQPAEKVSCAKVQNIAKITLGWVVKISNFGCAKSFVMKYSVFVYAVLFTLSLLSGFLYKNSCNTDML